MKKFSLKMVALIAAMMMCLTAEAKTEDVGGRVIDMQGEPLPFVMWHCSQPTLLIYKVQRAMWMVSSRSKPLMPAAFCDSHTSVIAPRM